jgi:putative lipoic acid-binding regulatory protein
MPNNKLENLKLLLDTEYTWPASYLFKFIVTQDQVENITSLFTAGEVSVRESSKGKYVSVSIQIEMPSSDEIIHIYEKAATIPGVIAL